MYAIASTSKTRPTLFWTGHGWADAPAMAMRFASIVDALCESAAWRCKGHKADTVVKL